MAKQYEYVTTHGEWDAHGGFQCPPGQPDNPVTPPGDGWELINTAAIVKKDSYNSVGLIWTWKRLRK